MAFPSVPFVFSINICNDTLQLFTFFHSSVTAFVISFHHLVSEIKMG